MRSLIKDYFRTLFAILLPCLALYFCFFLSSYILEHVNPFSVALFLFLAVIVPIITLLTRAK